MVGWRNPKTCPFIVLGAIGSLCAAVVAVPDTDQDGLPDVDDPCPAVSYTPGFDADGCAPMDLDPDNDAAPECKARERILDFMLNNGRFTTDIAFAVVINGHLHFADAFTYLGGGQWTDNPDGVNRLYRIGSTTKAVVAVTAKIMEESGELSLNDFVSDDDASQLLVGGQVTLRNLLSQRGAFKSDAGLYRSFCYPDDLVAFWADPDDATSPHFDSPTYGNLNGGFAYSAFNLSLAGAYLAWRTGEPFAQVVQTRLFDGAGMCTATFDGPRATASPIGSFTGYSQTPTGDVGPAINLFSMTDPSCEDNFYSTDDLLGDPYTWQPYMLDEASAEARDPAGGAIASVIDMAHFAEALLSSYRAPGGLISQAGIRELWAGLSPQSGSWATSYGAYYGLGFFTDTQAGQPVTRAGHGGERAGYNSVFELRPEDNMGVAILVNANIDLPALTLVGRTILADFAAAPPPTCAVDLDGDNDTDVFDFGVFAATFGSVFGDAAFNPGADLDDSGAIDVLDFGAFAAAFGCPN